MSTEVMKALVSNLYEEIWAGNLDVLEDHPGMHEVIPMITASLDASTNQEYRIVQQLVDGNWVVTRMLRSFVLTKDFMDGKAGEHVQLEIISMSQIQDGIVVMQHSQAGRIG